MRFPTPPHSIQQMSLLKALTVAAIPVVIVVLHIPAVGIELLTDTLRLQTRIRSTSYCSSTWWVDEVTTQFRGDQKRLQSLGTGKGIWNRGYLLTYLSSCRQWLWKKQMGPVYEIHGSGAGVTTKMLDFGDSLHSTRPAGIKCDSIHHSQSRSVFPQELVGLIGRALN